MILAQCILSSAIAPRSLQLVHMGFPRPQCWALVIRFTCDGALGDARRAALANQKRGLVSGEGSSGMTYRNTPPTTAEASRQERATPTSRQQRRGNFRSNASRDRGCAYGLRAAPATPTTCHWSIDVTDQASCCYVDPAALLPRILGSLATTCQAEKEGAAQPALFRPSCSAPLPAPSKNQQVPLKLARLSPRQNYRLLFILNASSPLSSVLKRPWHCTPSLVRSLQL